MGEKALAGIRVCDLSGQLAGAGATRFLAAFGAEVIRVEDPVRRGGWDILRGGRPYIDERRGPELGGAFNNHNVGKRGVTINLRSPEGRDVFTRLVEVSDVVTENFAAGVLAGLGFPYDRLREINPSVIYVSNSGFGHAGPYAHYKSWGPIVQALSGLTFTSGLAGHPPAGWGFSYMDHMGANFMALAVLAALVHRNRTGEGQWVDLAMTEVGLTLIGPALLDATVHDRPMRRSGMPDSNHSESPAMAPHGVYPARGDDCWVAIACRDDADWLALAAVIGEEWAWDARFDSLAGRRSCEDDLDRHLSAWSSTCDRFELATRLRRAGVPAEAVQRPSERIDHDPETAAWGLWPTVSHPQMGEVRVDGLPLHLSLTDWHMETGAPMLGQHNRDVFCGLLGIDDTELDELHAAGGV
ncbi:MAG TPA: CoA transferase [Acidimicrobiales bacterium]|nr:CoA transferase [Acidimicrobiales bacterium]